MALTLAAAVLAVVSGSPKIQQDKMKRITRARLTRLYIADVTPLICRQRGGAGFHLRGAATRGLIAKAGNLHLDAANNKLRHSQC